MKERELREKCICLVCRRPVGKTSIPILHTFQVERHVLDLQAIKRQSGVEQMMAGEVALAQVLGPDEDMTCCLGTAAFSVCEECMLERFPGLMVAYERSNSEDPEDS